MCPVSTSYKKIRAPNYVSHRKLLRPVLKEIIYNNILEFSLTRSIARKPQSCGGFKKIVLTAQMAEWYVASVS